MAFGDVLANVTAAPRMGFAGLLASRAEVLLCKTFNDVVPLDLRTNTSHGMYLKGALISVNQAHRQLGAS